MLFSIMMNMIKKGKIHNMYIASLYLDVKIKKM